MKVIELRNQDIGVGRVPGQPEDVWQLVLTDKGNGDVHFLFFNQVVRDALVAQMTSGIVIANGKPPM